MYLLLYTLVLGIILTGVYCISILFVLIFKKETKNKWEVMIDNNTKKWKKNV